MVRFTRLIANSLTVALVVALPAGAMSQTADQMTAEQITEAFKKQKTRGLVIVPSSQQASSDTAAATTVAPTTPAAYNAVDQADQVNVQIKFDFDSATLRDDQKEKLATLCQVMQDVDVSVFQIIGHTDSSGSAEYNQRLSLLRAEEVKRHMVSDCGIDANRLEAVGLGESAPFDATDPRADVNRRVEFQALG
ncbi:OmpA family protein [Albibacillus kandeliae]|uniref:OmpA family protein n=1 Tax=Albibacillus kandeliae TaxID=2174228 RepID=UPI000D688480|nr:OmpA family protein [Albibacillus kandeliae]